MWLLDAIRFLFGSGKSEQELYEESLQEARELVFKWERSQPIAKSARRRIPQIVKGLQLDGIQADADLIHRLAMVAADGYIGSQWHDRFFGRLDEDAVREVFEAEYTEAYEDGRFFYPSEDGYDEE